MTMNHDHQSWDEIGSNILNRIYKHVVEGNVSRQLGMVKLESRPLIV